MSLTVKNTTPEEVTGYYKKGNFKDNIYIKAALEMAGCDEFAYTRTDNIRGDSDTGGIYYIYPSGTKGPQPYRAKIEFYVHVSGDGKIESSISVDFQLNGFDGYEHGEYKAVSYEEAFRRLKTNDYRSVHWEDDLSGVSENDVLCELVYTDAIDLHYLIPCYKFYVEVKDETWLNQEQVSGGEKMYFFYYVPAVDMNENPQTSDANAAAAVALCAASLLGAALILRIKTKKY